MAHVAYLTSRCPDSLVHSEKRSWGYVHLACHMYISIYYIPHLHTSKDMLLSKGTHFFELAFHMSPAHMQLASTCIGAYLPAGSFHDVNFEMEVDIWTLTSTEKLKRKVIFQKFQVEVMRHLAFKLWATKVQLLPANLWINPESSLGEAKIRGRIE